MAIMNGRNSGFNIVGQPLKVIQLRYRANPSSWQLMVLPLVTCAEIINPKILNLIWRNIRNWSGEHGLPDIVIVVELC